MVTGNPRIRLCRLMCCFAGVVIVLLLFVTPILASEKAYIALELDGREVFFGDTVVLEVESTGLLDPIDFSIVYQQAELLRETTGTRIAVIGGKVSEIAIRRMDLIPKRPGVLVIGPLQAGEITSNSVHVRVLDSVRPDWQPAPDDIQIKTKLTPTSVRVNQQVLLTIELLHRYPVNSEQITLPELQGFSKRTVHSARRTFKGDNREWYRTEYRYLIYPRQSGTLVLGEIQWNGNIARSRVERADFKRTSGELNIEVTPISPEADTWWLPGSDIELTESWSQPPTSLKAGDELERTITVQANGVLSGQIPALEVPESRALQQTLINTSRKEQLVDNSIVSTAAFTYRVKAQSPIPVFLDTVRVSWWDITIDEAREAIIPARRINVGLPERADILSKIALEDAFWDTGASRLKLMLQSTGGLRLGIYTLALISLAGLGWSAMQMLVRRSGKRSDANKHLAAMRSAACHNDTLELYRLLKAPESPLFFGDAHHKLMRSIENTLFTTNQLPDRVNPPVNVDIELKRIKKIIGQTGYSPETPRNQALAEI